MTSKHNNRAAGNYSPLDALRWGWTRHKLIAELAEKQVKSVNAKAQIEKILKVLGVLSLADVANWADEIREGNVDPNEPNNKDFLEDERNSWNDQWHYVNLPLGVSGYDPRKYPKFTRENDVVQVINQTVAVLLGKTERFSVPNALRLLVHFVGDVHQPVHVGCCYISAECETTPKLITKPNEADEFRVESDRGGNRLLLSEGGNESLHSFWDSGFGLPVDDGWPKSLSEEDYIASLLSDITLKRKSNNTGPMGSWVAQWAKKSLDTALSAYDGITIKAAHASKPGKFTINWEGKDKYIERNKEALNARIQAGGSNLAEMLDAIWP